MYIIATIVVKESNNFELLFKFVWDPPKDFVEMQNAKPIVSTLRKLLWIKLTIITYNDIII